MNSLDTLIRGFFFNLLLGTIALGFTRLGLKLKLKEACKL